MQHCARCGNYNSKESIFCSHCGNRLNNNCPDCGFANLPQQRFCGNCGKQIQADAAVMTGSGFTPEPGLVGASLATGAARPETATREQAVALPGEAPVQGGVSFPEIPRDPHPGRVAAELPAYALASIEVANWDAIRSRAAEAEGLEHARRQMLLSIEQRVIAAQGQINASKNGTLFISFKREGSLDASIGKCVSLCLELLGEKFAYESRPLHLRIGLDIEHATARNPLTSTVERSMGLPGTLTLSEAAYASVSDFYKAETVGPVPMGNRMMQFYRIVRPGRELPHVEQVLPLSADLPSNSGILAGPAEPYPGSAAPLPPSITENADLPSGEALSEAKIQVPDETVSAGMPDGPVRPWEETGALPSADSLSESRDVFPAEGAGRSETAESAEIFYSPAESWPQEAITAEQTVQSTQIREEQARPESVREPSGQVPDNRGDQRAQAVIPPQGESAPAPVHYEAPVFGQRKITRPANLDYEQAIDALTSELSGFLAQGERGKGRVVALCGTDGLGKSNLVSMAREKADPGGQRAVWMGGSSYRCFQGGDLPLFFWLELLHNMLSLVFEGQINRDVREQLQQFLSLAYEGPAPPEDEAFLLSFLSVQPPQPLSMETRAQLGACESFFFGFLKHMAARRSVVLVIEDLQFADTASLELLCGLLERNLPDAPITLILNQTRDFHAVGRLGEALQKVSYKELVIGDLTEAEMERFLDDGPLGGRLRDFPSQLIGRLLHQARGLPIYLEESLRLLHLQEILTVDPESHKFLMAKPFEAGETALPEGLKPLIRQRLDYLDEKALYLLRLAAALGEKFAVSVLMALSQLEEAEFNEALTGLFNHGLLYPDAVNTGRFRHGLIWEAVYEDIDTELRFQMHQLISETLEHDFEQGLTVNPLLIAHHAEQGGLPKRALNYWNLGGIFAAEAGSLTGLNIAVFHALDLLGKSSPEPLYTHELALRMVENLGAFNLAVAPDFSVELLEWAVFYRQFRGDTSYLLESLGFLASAYEHQGDYSQALASIDRALELVNPKTYPLEAGSLLMSKMEHLVMLGRWQQARELMETAIEPLASRAATDGQGRDFYDAYLNARLLKAQLLVAQCDHEAGVVIEDALKQAGPRGLEGLGVALELARAQLQLRNGQFENCNREADTLLNAIEAMEDSDWFLAQWGLLAMNYHCELEDWESANQLVLTVVSKAEAARDYHTWIMAQLYAGLATGNLGKTREARQLLEKAIQLSSDYRFASCALTGWRFLAEFELSLGNKEVAAEISARALEIADKPEIRNIYESIKLSLVNARALMAQRQIKEAGILLEGLWPQVVKTRMQPLIAQCAQEIGFLYKHLAQDAPSDLSKKHLMRSVEFFLKAKGIWLELRHLPNVKKIDAVIPKL